MKQQAARTPKGLQDLTDAAQANALEMLMGPALESKFVQTAYKKSRNPIDKSVFLGMLAGFWVGLGGLAGLSAAGGISEAVRHTHPILPKMAVGFFFPFALHFILIFGGDLFTGNTMVMTVGLVNKRVSVRRLLCNWAVVYFANMVGAVATAYFFGYLTEVFAANPYRSWVTYMAEAKTTQYGFGVLFLRAIPANVLVCLGVFLGQGARDGAGKFFHMWFPPLLFVLVGFEHSVANMFFVTIGMMYGASTTVGQFLYNQAAVALGNMIGGALFVGCSMHVINAWNHSLFAPRPVDLLNKPARSAAMLEEGECQLEMETAKIPTQPRNS